VGPCRAPFNKLSESAVAAIKETLKTDHARGMN